MLAFAIQAIGAQAASLDHSAIASKVEADLETALSRVLPQDGFLVHANATVATISEKKLIEGETVAEVAPREKPQPEPMPGFIAPPRPPRAPVAPTQSKQIFKTVERDVLRSVGVQVTLDQALPQQSITDARSIVRRYLSTSYGDKASAQFSMVKMIHPKKASAATLALATAGSTVLGLLPWLITLGTAAIAYLMWRKLRSSSQQNATQPAPQTSRVELQAQAPSASVATKAALSQRLLASFLESSDSFRAYFPALSPQRQVDLAATLAGPAFDALLATLNLKVASQRTEAPQELNEEQLMALEIEFRDFVRTHRWQLQQFFGFLAPLSNEQLAVLARRESPLFAAVALRFLSADRSARVFELLTTEDRRRIVAKSAEAATLPAGEVVAVEKLLRTSTERMPVSIRAAGEQEEQYWAAVLSRCENPEILEELKTLRPDLYPKISKYAFSLSDIPSLPESTIEKVLDQIDNEEIAMAISICDPKTQTTILKALGERRRALVRDQAVAFQGLPPESMAPAQRVLTQKFREVLQ